MPDFTSDVSFYLNGRRVDLRNVSPSLLLVDFLREQGLTGAKIACGEGGCGACTVMLSRLDRGRTTVEHVAINSCLRPVCAVDGMEVTTVESLGSVRTGLDPVPYRVAAHNGSQCGFCTPGVVMSAHAFLCEHPHPSAREIEQSLDGNICRCTGYKRILEAILDAGRRMAGAAR